MDFRIRDPLQALVDSRQTVVGFERVPAAFHGLDKTFHRVLV
jgi:hypothetical protein